MVSFFYFYLSLFICVVFYSFGYCFVCCCKVGNCLTACLVYGRDLYLWASTIITSRAFSSKVLSGVIDESELPEDRVSVLLPLIDLPNHRPLAKVEWRAGAEDVGLLVLEDVAPGQEIANNYGPRNNEQREYCLPSLISNRQRPITDNYHYSDDELRLLSS